MSGVIRGIGTRIRARATHVGANWRAIARIALAPSLAWWVSTAIFGHSQAFFAPIAAILTLTIGVGRRATVVLEIIIGASMGVLVGELLIHLIGRGVGQMIFVVGIAAVVAYFARISGVA
ncbi:MAG TPA: FUSC family protein, partial [Beutenbergiaceae bacterium]|nr:FUSC family protein [Beutenbergiaceae bacterium]